MNDGSKRAIVTRYLVKIGITTIISELIKYEPRHCFQGNFHARIGDDDEGSGRKKWVETI